jgi:hypothetical protein
MIYLRRALFIVLAAVAVTMGILQLDGSTWAQRLRIRDQERQMARLKYMRSHKTPDRPLYPRQSTLKQYARGFVEVVVLEMGLPCAATLGLLACTRRKRRHK